jgi:peptidoglycan/xylan/chitin deacetylase (PgdA/CDA1 family)
MIFLGAAAILLAAVFLLWKTRYGYPPGDVPQILCYHKLSEKMCFEGTWMPPRRFLRQIERLIDGGFEFVDEGFFLNALAEPAAAGRRKILLTFDDGYAELYEMCLSHLLPRGIPVLVFVPSEYIGQRNDWELSLGRRPFEHLSRPQIETLARSGVSFGSHGARHLDLTRLDTTELEREVLMSKTTIEEITGAPVRSFSYPFGRYNEQVRGEVSRAGYEAAFSLYPKHCNEITDRFALRRNGVYIIDTPFTIRCKLTPSPVYWFEEMKCRAINAVAALTPLVKRFSAGPGR